jgi:hypothetical protein
MRRPNGHGQAGGHRPALVHGGATRCLAATARATTGSVGWPGGSTALATDATTLRASSAVQVAASAVRAASGGACLGAAALDATAVRRPCLRR